MTDLTIDIAETRPGLAEIFTSEPPMKRMGDRTDLKGAVVYLLSRASAYMTGGEGEGEWGEVRGALGGTGGVGEGDEYD